MDFITTVGAQGSLNNFVHAHREAFNIGGNFPVYWYGIIFMCGFGIAVLAYCLRLKFYYKVSWEPAFYYLFLCVPVTILCARLWSLAIGDAQNFFDFRSGGLAIQGGVIGGVIAAAIFFPLILKKPAYHVADVDADGNKVIRQVSMWVYADAIIPTILIGQALGRWGNFINGEIFGAEATPESLNWLKNAMPAVFEGMKHYLTDLLQPGSIIDPNTPYLIYQPLFLYESFFNIIVFLFIYLVVPLIKQIRIGVVASSYFMFYGIIRFVTESARASQFTFAGTYVINSLLLVFGLLGIILIQFLVPRFRNRFILDSIFAFMLPKSWRKKLTDIRQPNEFLFYCHR